MVRIFRDEVTSKIYVSYCGAHSFSQTRDGSVAVEKVNRHRIISDLGTYLNEPQSSE